MTKEKTTQCFVYHIVNNINGKLYVGITVNCNKRWKRHIFQSKYKIKHAIHLAIAKYGEHNFTFKEIETCSNWDQACERECFWIKHLKENGYQLYNETNGGEGSLGVRRYGKDNPNFGKEMKPHVKKTLLEIHRKLTNEQIEQVNQLYSTGNFTQTQLSEKFHVSLTTIHRIVKGKSKAWGDKEHDTIFTKKNMTKEDVIELRKLYATGKYKQKELAEKYNCSQNHIHRIVTYKKWKNV